MDEPARDAQPEMLPGVSEEPQREPGAEAGEGKREPRLRRVNREQTLLTWIGLARWEMASRLAGIDGPVGAARRGPGLRPRSLRVSRRDQHVYLPSRQGPVLRGERETDRGDSPAGPQHSRRPYDGKPDSKICMGGIQNDAPARTRQGRFDCARPDRQPSG